MKESQDTYGKLEMESCLSERETPAPASSVNRSVQGELSGVPLKDRVHDKSRSDAEPIASRAATTMYFKPFAVQKFGVRDLLLTEAAGICLKIQSNFEILLLFIVAFSF